MGKPFEASLVMDSLGAFDLGMDSHDPPVVLPRNKAAFLTNATIHNGFLTHRGPYNNFTLSYTDAVVELGFTTGLWQGACFYRPDFGNECLIASIGGRIFKVTPSTDTATVEEITPTSPNPNTSPQAWLWQGENYIFINDGVSAPIVYNNQTSIRLSQGELVATISTGGTLLAGGTLSVTLTAPYTGQYNVPLLLKSASGALKTQVQVQALGAGYNAIVTNISDGTGTPHVAGEQFVKKGSYLGTVATGGAATQRNPITFSLTTPYWCQDSDHVRNLNELSTNEYSINSISADRKTLTVHNTDNAPVTHFIQVGHQISRNNPTSDLVIATLDTPGFNAPAPGLTATIVLTAPYVGPAQIVVIGGAVYKIEASMPASSATVNLVNLDTTTSYTVVNGDTLNTIPQLPPGRMGVYGLGRNWISLPDGISYVASDIVGSSSGTIAFNYRDAILNITENSYLAGGGIFRVPSSGQVIQGLVFPATLDTSLGQGALQVLTPLVTFSCNAPVDRNTWQALTNPIQTQSLVSNGGLSHYSTVVVNGDVWFRAPDGIRSLVLGRRDFIAGHGNTPQSIEMSRVLDADNEALLGFCSGIYFDSRLLMTANPVQHERGVYHNKLIALLFDPQSSIQEKKPPVYDGVWEGMNVLQVVKGTFGVKERAFAFVLLNPDGETPTIGLKEILTSAPGNNFDDSTTPIRFSAESAALFYQPEPNKRSLLQLNDGEIVVSELVGTVRFDIYFRPDWDSAWHSWHSWQVGDNPAWQPRMGIGKPKTTPGDPATGRPFTIGYSFQFLIVVTGHCMVMGLNAFCNTMPQDQFPKPLPSLTPLTT